MIHDEYYQWLCGIIHVNQETKSYWLLIRSLHKKEFFGIVPNDDNRGMDGKNLRIQFENATGLSSEKLDGPCSFLEMLIALAQRFDENMIEPPEDSSPYKWFWEMLKNVGLDECTDDACGEPYFPAEYIDGVLNQVLERTYRRSGKGGLFPLKFTKKDQRTVEIWYQMQEYLSENYYAAD